MEREQPYRSSLSIIRGRTASDDDVPRVMTSSARMYLRKASSEKP